MALIEKTTSHTASELPAVHTGAQHTCQLSQAICTLVDYALAHELIAYEDRIWAYNSVLEAIGTHASAPCERWVLGGCHTAGTQEVRAEQRTDTNVFELERLLSPLVDAAVYAGTVQGDAIGRESAAMRIMGRVTPRPSQVIERFQRVYRHAGEREASRWFYALCCDTGYVRRSAIARNITWVTPTRWGSLELTINRSKPEKDPRAIAAAGKPRASGETYPACQLCIENEGYAGRLSTDSAGEHPPRQNLRIVPVTLNGEPFGFQYSPYAYFNEHCIVMSALHRPMHIDRASLACLLDFVDFMPHYFIGSNADLPIVGGSILSHDHFQGGDHVFPMMRAASQIHVDLPAYPDVQISVLEWPVSTLRLLTTHRDELLDAAVHIVERWRIWSDEKAGIFARDADGTPHNTVTPIVRRVSADGSAGGDTYEAYLALRCNVTSPAHPLGVFHPHEKWHHIKRENIGLIEVMGLAILPPRLIDEQAGGKVDELPKDYIGEVFAHVLEDAGVFKGDDEGRRAQQRFLSTL